MKDLVALFGIRNERIKNTPAEAGVFFVCERLFLIAVAHLAILLVAVTLSLAAAAWAVHEDHGAGAEPGDGEGHDEVDQGELDLRERKTCRTKAKVERSADGDGHHESNEVAGVFDVETNEYCDSTEEFNEGGEVGEECWCWEAHLGDAGGKSFHARHLAK